jgi:hypothetical protein
MRKLALVLLLALGSLLAARSTSADGPKPHVHAVGGLTVRVPAGWHVVRQRMSDVTDPYPRLAMATFAVKLSPHPCECDTPNIENLPRRGAFLLVWEYLHIYKAELRKVPRRPSRFTVTQDNHRWFECAGPSWTTGFRAAGRVFQVEVYLGPAAGKRVRSRVETILDTFVVARLPGP